MKFPVVMTFLLSALSAAPLLHAAPDKEEVAMPLAEMPAAVQKTIQANLDGGAVVKSEKEKRGGQVIYEAVVAKGARERFAIEVAPDGKLIEIARGTGSNGE